jgi:hypothetical protein
MTFIPNQQISRSTLKFPLNNRQDAFHRYMVNGESDAVHRNEGTKCAFVTSVTVAAGSFVRPKAVRNIKRKHVCLDAGLTIPCYPSNIPRSKQDTLSQAL